MVMPRNVSRLAPTIVLASGLALLVSGCSTPTVAVEASREPEEAPVVARAAPQDTAKRSQKDSSAEAGPPAKPDKATKLVTGLLRPSEKAFVPAPIQPPTLAGPRALEQTEPLPPPFAGGVLHPRPLKMGKMTLPRPLAEESPLARLDSGLG